MTVKGEENQGMSARVKSAALAASNFRPAPNKGHRQPADALSIEPNEGFSHLRDRVHRRLRRLENDAVRRRQG